MGSCGTSPTACTRRRPQFPRVSRTFRRSAMLSSIATSVAEDLQIMGPRREPGTRPFRGHPCRCLQRGGPARGVQPGEAAAARGPAHRRHPSRHRRALSQHAAVRDRMKWRPVLARSVCAVMVGQLRASPVRALHRPLMPGWKCKVADIGVCGIWVIETFGLIPQVLQDSLHNSSDGLIILMCS